MLTIDKLTQQYRYGATALTDISLSGNIGELVCILGSSESGKTSLLKTICGINKIKSGKIFINGIDAETLSIKERNVCLMHEDGAFFENKTAFYNLFYPLKIRRISEEIAKKKISFVADKFGLYELFDVKVKKLSKIDRFVLNLARMYLRDANIYLFDNPFKGIENRKENFDKYLNDIKEINRNALIVFATDSAYEAEKINGKTYVLNYGFMQAVGNFSEVKNSPESITVYRLFFDDIITEKTKIIDDTVDINGKKYKINVNALINKIYVGEDVIAAYRIEPSTANPKGIRLYDYHSERLIYFDEII